MPEPRLFLANLLQIRPVLLSVIDPSQTSYRYRMSVIGRWLCLVAFAILGQVVRSQPFDVSVTMPDRHCAFLVEALDTALRQSPQMLQKNIGLAKADALRISRDAIRWPSLGGSGRFERSNLSATGVRSSTSSGLLYNVGLSQALFRWGDVKNTVEIDRLDVLLSQKNFAEAYRDLVANLRTQFLQLILKKRNLAITRFNAAGAMRVHKENEEKMKTGQISSGEFASSEIMAEETQINLQTQEMQYDQAKQAFARLSGCAVVPDDRVPDQLPAPEFSADQATRLMQYFDQKDLAKSTPLAESKLYVIKQSELRYKLASTRLLPKWDVNVSLNQMNTTNFSNQSVGQNVTNQKAIGIAGNWTVFDGFATRGAKRLALAEKREAQMDLETYLKSLDEQKQNLIAFIGLSARSLALAERKLEMSRGGLAFAEEELKIGRLSEDQVNQLKGNRMSMEYAAMTARADLYTRWADFVSLLWLDPALQKLPARYLSHGK